MVIIYASRLFKKQKSGEKDLGKMEETHDGMICDMMMMKELMLFSRRAIFSAIQCTKISSIEWKLILAQECVLFENISLNHF